MDTSRDKVQKKPVRLIAAACRGMGIGKDGKLPWHLPSEFQYFLNTITQVSKPGKMNLLVWGKLCWYSNPETMFPVANNLHVVLSKTLNTVPDHAHFLCQNFEKAILLAVRPPLADLIETIWVVGGTQVYKEALKHPWCDLIYLTDVMADFDCDVFFPEFDRRLFKEQERFLLHCLEDLDASLRKLNSRLFVIRGQPTDVFPRLFKEWEITRLSYEYDSEPFGKERDAAIQKLANEAGVEVVVRVSHTLYNLVK